MGIMSDIQEASDFLNSRGVEAPQIGIVLGTGLGNLAKRIDAEVEVAYTDIPHFPPSTMEFHSGKLIYGNLGEVKVAALQGRYHYYEGYTMQQIIHPVRVLKNLGVKYILLSNAAGAVNLNFKKGNLMLIDDHINLLPENPLTGRNIDELGPRFPDMSAPYSPEVNRLIKQAANDLGINLNEGVYASVSGPNLETRAEYRYLKIIGADAVGMSTVPEVIACNHMGVPCAAVSVLTDECDPDKLSPVDINEIIAVAGIAEVKLAELFSRVVQMLPLD